MWDEVLINIFDTFSFENYYILIFVDIHEMVIRPGIKFVILNPSRSINLNTNILTRQNYGWNGKVA